jgi:hypothetical protein
MKELQDMLKEILINLFVATPLAIYTGVIVSRYYMFIGSLNEARRFVLNLEQTWKYQYLNQVITDPESPSGKRTVSMSKCVESNNIDWQLMQVGLQLKEQGHWKAAAAIDNVSIEIEGLRNEFLSAAKLKVKGHAMAITEYIADWHRRLSRQKPNSWRILQPWPNKRYQHISCISVDEATGTWQEVKPEGKSEPLLPES